DPSRSRLPALATPHISSLSLHDALPIFVFFDPIGQALCKRTLNLVERLTHLYSERMRFFLSKADEAGFETDRQKVMMQIIQTLRSEEHTSELQSRFDLVCRLLLEKNTQV